MERSLILNSRFWPLFVTQFMGAFNDNIFKNALVILITYKAVALWGLGTSELVALAGGIFILPYLLFSATAGQICDFYQKRTIIIATKFTEVLVVSLALLGLALSDFKLLMFVLFLFGLQSTFFGPLKYGSLRDLVGENKLVPANALVNAGTFVAVLMGTLVGGTLVSLEQYLVPLCFTLLLVSLVGLLSAFQLPHLLVYSNDSNKVDWTFFKPTWRVLKLTWKDRELFSYLMCISWFWFLGAAILSILPVLVREVYFASEAVATLFLTTFTLGMGFGAYFAQRVGKESPELGLPPVALLGLGGFLVLLAIFSKTTVLEGDVLMSLYEFLSFPESWIALFCLLMVATLGGCYIVPLMSAVQIKAIPSELSRVIAGNNIWNAIFMIFSSLGLMLGYASGLDVIDLLLILALINTIVAFVQYALETQRPIRFVASMIAHLFYRIKVEGSENLPAQGPYIIVCNHVSFVDWLFVLAASKRPVQFVIDYNYYYLPGFPFWLKQARLIPIATRKEKAELLEVAFRNISSSLKEGAVVGIFPEGTITRTGKVRRFMSGLSKIVERDPVPVIPMALNGLWGSFFSRSGKGALKKWPSLSRRKVRITIGAPIGPERVDLKELQRQVTSLHDAE